MGTSSPQKRDRSQKGPQDITPVPFSIRLDPDLHERFKAACEAHDRKMGPQARRLIREFVRDFEAEQVA